MMLNAVVLPIMIRATKQVTTRVTYMLFAGTPDPGRTLERKSWNGRPLSLAKENIWRDDVVT